MCWQLSWSSAICRHWIISGAGPTDCRYFHVLNSEISRYWLIENDRLLQECFALQILSFVLRLSLSGKWHVRRVLAVLVLPPSRKMFRAVTCFFSPKAVTKAVTKSRPCHCRGAGLLQAATPSTRSWKSGCSVSTLQRLSCCCLLVPA